MTTYLVSRRGGSPGLGLGLGFLTVEAAQDLSLDAGVVLGGDADDETVREPLSLFCCRPLFRFQLLPPVGDRT